MKNVIQKSLIVIMAIMACGQVDARAAFKAMPKATVVTQAAKRSAVATQSWIARNPVKAGLTAVGSVLVAGLARQVYLMRQVSNQKAALEALKAEQAKPGYLTKEQRAKLAKESSLSSMMQDGAQGYDEAVKKELDAAQALVDAAEKARNESWFKQACDKCYVTAGYNAVANKLGSWKTSVSNWWNKPAADADKDAKQKENKAEAKK